RRAKRGTVPIFAAARETRKKRDSPCSVPVFNRHPELGSGPIVPLDPACWVAPPCSKAAPGKDGPEKDEKWVLKQVQDDGMGWGGLLSPFAPGLHPICHRMNANSSAVSRRLSKRPDLPPWPAPMLVFRSSSLSSVLSSRSRATHLAGS